MINEHASAWTIPTLETLWQDVKRKSDRFPPVLSKHILREMYKSLLKGHVKKNTCLWGHPKQCCSLEGLQVTYWKVSGSSLCPIYQNSTNNISLSSKLHNITPKRVRLHKKPCQWQKQQKCEQSLDNWLIKVSNVCAETTQTHKNKNNEAIMKSRVKVYRGSIARACAVSLILREFWFSTSIDGTKIHALVTSSV